MERAYSLLVVKYSINHSGAFFVGLMDLTPHANRITPSNRRWMEMWRACLCCRNEGRPLNILQRPNIGDYIRSSPLPILEDGVMARVKTWREWTNHEERFLAQMYRRGTRTTEMASILGRTKHAIERKASELRSRGIDMPRGSGG